MSDQSTSSSQRPGIQGKWRIALWGMIQAFVGGGVVVLVFRATGYLGPVTEYGMFVDAALLSAILIVAVIGLATLAGVALSEVIKRSNAPGEEMALSAEDIDE